MILPRRTTPHTRLSWNSLGGWQDAALAINARPPSRLRHLQIECHVIVLEAAYINACSSAALLRSVKDLLTSGDFRHPCRGRRADAPHTPLIVAINNRLQRLETGAAMNLIKHSYGGHKPARYYIDGKRVSPNRYELTVIEARIAGWQHSSFWGRTLCTVPGREHYLYGSSINR